MKDETIQTLHADAAKANKGISLRKYEVIEETLFSILLSQEHTHPDLMEVLYENVKNAFEGGVQWYGQTVKLALAAGGIICQTKTKPEKYRLTK